MSMKITRYLAPAMLAGSLLVGSTSGVFAAKSKAAAHRASAYGQVSNLTTSGFTLTQTATKAETTASPKVNQVLLSSTTKEKARKGTTGSLTNGDYALVVGPKSATGISANRVLYSHVPFNPHNRHLVAGLVNGNATTSTSISITTAKGKTFVFAITPQTKYRVNKVLATTAPILANGEKVRVRFSRNAATKALTALVIAVVPAA